MNFRDDIQTSYRQHLPAYDPSDSSRERLCEMMSILRERMARVEANLEQCTLNEHHIRQRMALQENSRDNSDLLISELRHQQRDIEREIRELRILQDREMKRPDVFEALTPWAKILLGLTATTLAYAFANPGLVHRLSLALFPP